MVQRGCPPAVHIIGTVQRGPRKVNVNLAVLLSVNVQTHLPLANSLSGLRLWIRLMTTLNPLRSPCRLFCEHLSTFCKPNVNLEYSQKIVLGHVRNKCGIVVCVCFLFCDPHPTPLRMSVNIANPGELAVEQWTSPSLLLSLHACVTVSRGRHSNLTVRHQALGHRALGHDMEQGATGHRARGQKA